MPKLFFQTQNAKKLQVNHQHFNAPGVVPSLKEIKKNLYARKHKRTSWFKGKPP